jgi:hypothetical protein
MRLNLYLKMIHICKESLITKILTNKLIINLYEHLKEKELSYAIKLILRKFKIF